MVSGNPDALLAPFSLGRLRLANRVAVAPMTRVSATAEGFATAGMANYYARFARGGFGLLITEGIYPDQAYAQGYAGQPGLSDDGQARAWREVVEAVHRQGGVIFAQLMHAGALSQFNRFRGDTVGASPIRPRGRQLSLYRGSGPFSLPRQITQSEIDEAIEGFAAAAKRAKEIAGFDGIEVHGANGYLLDQFLTGETNQRADRYGGPAAARAQLTVEVVAAVRRAIGEDLSLGVRISQAKVNDFEHRWPGGAADAAAVFGRLNDCDLDYVHVAEHAAWRAAFAGSDESLAALARRHAPKLSVIANGQLHDPARARAMIDKGEADVVALGRGALANPGWPRQVRAGLPLASFDPAMLAPLAELREAETASLPAR